MDAREHGESHQFHGDIESLGLRFGDVAYSTDASGFPEESPPHYANLDLWILGALCLASGLDMSGYDALMKGTRYGSIVKPGDSLSSVLIMLVEGRANPAIKMPHGKAELPKDKIAILRAWVDQGAKNN